MLTISKHTINREWITIYNSVLETLLLLCRALTNNITLSYNGPVLSPYSSHTLKPT